MGKMLNRGTSLVKVIILIIAFCAVIGGCFFLIGQEKAKTRDAKRLSDITRVQAAFEFLYNDSASFEQAATGGCDTKGMLVSQCNLSAFLPSIKEFVDPGKFSYTVSTVPSSDDYGITFRLEKSYGTLKSGVHTLTPEGIK